MKDEIQQALEKRDITYIIHEDRRSSAFEVYAEESEGSVARAEVGGTQYILDGERYDGDINDSALHEILDSQELNETKQK